MADKPTARLDGRMEDCVLSPPALLVGSSARVLARTARNSRAPFPAIRRAGGFLRTRPRLRTDDSAKRDCLLHGRLFRTTEARKYPRCGIQCEVVRYRLRVHAGRNHIERALFSDDFANRANGRFRQDCASRIEKRRYSLRLATRAATSVTHANTGPTAWPRPTESSSAALAVLGIEDRGLG